VSAEPRTTDTSPDADGLDWRVPQSFTEATSTEVRDVIQDFVVRDLLGPWDGPTEILGLVAGEPKDPRDRYLVGTLGPRKTDRVEDTESVDLDLGATESSEPELPEVVNPRMLGKLWVSSMGLSFEVAANDDASRLLIVEVDAGRYVNEEVELDEATASGRARRITARRRVPMHWSVEVDLDQADGRVGLELDGRTSERPDPDGIWLRSQVRDHDGRRIVRITLINNQHPDVTPKLLNWIFQSQLTVTALDGARPIFLPSGHADTLHTDAEEAHLDLLFRHAPDFAEGHNIAVRVDRRERERNAWRLTTEWMPVAELPQVTAPTLPDMETGMAQLVELASANDSGPLINALRPLITGYAVWLEKQRAAADQLADVWRPVADQAIRNAETVIQRLEAALALLAEDPQARRAFAFANEAMGLQRHNTVAASHRERDPQLTYAQALEQVTDGEKDVKNASWRPFQLAFVLLNLPALTGPDAEERRERVDLLFFPTGGGKTEAYLGLAAYMFAIRRLQGEVGHGQQTRDGRAGVAVLMRYTLRLLTAQQFSRAAALVCAAEVIRRRDPETWGDQRFSIGLWVGMSVSPNWYGDAAQSIANARESGRRGSKIPVLQISYCPWCAEPLLGERDLHADEALRRIVVYCPRGEGPDPCPFSRRSSPLGIPVMTVDEEVYREPPSLLIATVDKLAQLPWYGFAGMLFGRVSSYCPRHGYRHRDLDERIGCGVRHNATPRLPAVTSQAVPPLRPPDLIIQDELHLISGALGSTVGLFEAAVEELTSWATPSGIRTSPKIIASTATTKRAREQVRQLFARDLSVFPPQVLDTRDTFFSVEESATPERPGRRYLGFCAHGSRLKAAEIRLAEVLLLAGQTALDAYGEPADPYATVVGYFNATRELAGMRRYLEDDVWTRVSRRHWRPGMSARAGQNPKITELTSRISAAYITDALHQLSVPFDPETKTSARSRAILAAMSARNGRRPDDLIDSWPADVALATSMLQVGVDVGRLGLMVITGQPKNVAEYIQASSRIGREADKPGLVITLYNWTRPRDLAYYESFHASHASLYRRVEALSVTPYARRCLDRGTAGVVVAAIRNCSEAWSVETAAQQVDLTSPAAKAVIERMINRAWRAGADGGPGYLREKIDSLCDRWRAEQARGAGALAYSRPRAGGVQFLTLLRPAGEGRWTELTVARSMRETEHDLNLLLPPAPAIFDPIYDAPEWRLATTSPDSEGSAENKAESAGELTP
jgi:hypothetical protein